MSPFTHANLVFLRRYQSKLETATYIERYFVDLGSVNEPDYN